MGRWWNRSEPEPGPIAGSTPARPGGAAAAPSPAAWRELPPIQRAVTPTPPVAPLQAFTASLVTAQNPSFLAPLGHSLDLSGPHGHVDGLAEPVAPTTYAGADPLPLAPAPPTRGPAAGVAQRALAHPVVQRVLATPVAQRVLGSPVAQAVAAAVPTVARVLDGETPVPPLGSPTPSPAPDDPSPDLATISPEFPDRPDGAAGDPTASPLPLLPGSATTPPVAGPDGGPAAPPAEPARGSAGSAPELVVVPTVPTPSAGRAGSAPVQRFPEPGGSTAVRPPFVPSPPLPPTPAGPDTRPPTSMSPATAGPAPVPPASASPADPLPLASVSPPPASVSPPPAIQRVSADPLAPAGPSGAGHPASAAESAAPAPTDPPGVGPDAPAPESAAPPLLEHALAPASGSGGEPGDRPLLGGSGSPIPAPADDPVPAGAVTGGRQAEGPAFPDTLARPVSTGAGPVGAAPVQRSIGEPGLVGLAHLLAGADGPQATGGRPAPRARIGLPLIPTGGTSAPVAGSPGAEVQRATVGATQLVLPAIAAAGSPPVSPAFPSPAPVSAAPAAAPAVQRSPVGWSAGPTAPDGALALLTGADAPIGGFDTESIPGIGRTTDRVEDAPAGLPPDPVAGPTVRTGTPGPLPVVARVLDAAAPVPPSGEVRPLLAQRSAVVFGVAPTDAPAAMTGPMPRSGPGAETAGRAPLAAAPGQRTVDAHPAGPLGSGSTPVATQHEGTGPSQGSPLTAFRSVDPGGGADPGPSGVAPWSPSPGRGGAPLTVLRAIDPASPEAAVTTTPAAGPAPRGRAEAPGALAVSTVPAAPLTVLRAAAPGFPSLTEVAPTGMRALDISAPLTVLRAVDPAAPPAPHPSPGPGSLPSPSPVRPAGPLVASPVPTPGRLPLPLASGPAATTAPSGPTTVDAALAAGIAQRVSADSVEFAPPRGEAGTPPAPAAEPAVQRTPADPVVQTATAAPPAGGGEGAALPSDLDELARRLFEPLSARLKTELWLDRERAGLISDLRR